MVGVEESQSIDPSIARQTLSAGHMQRSLT